MADLRETLLALLGRQPRPDDGAERGSLQDRGSVRRYAQYLYDRAQPRERASIGDFVTPYSDPSPTPLSEMGANGRPIGSVRFPDVLEQGAQIQAVQPAAAPPMARRGIEPPNAPRGTWPSEADANNQAFRDARTRAREQIRNEGYQFVDPGYIQQGQAYAQAVDRNRAAQAEMQNRENVSWEDWWRFRGRQDGHVVAPFDFANAYRAGPVPERYSARSRNPGPR